ncbi:MAG: tryptophan 7-halogenase, partial [Chloroflexi bacterium]|nr:tryptophan 7-halogenase [Chloroflexota bacterium]
STVIIDSRRSRNPALAESLPPSCRKLFAFLEILDDIDAAGYIRSDGNTVWWGEAEARVERFQGAPGYQVLRSDFDALLLDRARQAGAQILRNAMAREVALEAGAGARISYEDDCAAAAMIRSRFVLDCSGRTGILARKGFRQAGAGCRTIALAAMWQSENGWKVEDPRHTLVETYHDGWCWSVPVSSEVRYFTFMLDAQDTELERGTKLEGIYNAEIRKTRQFRRLLQDARPIHPVWGCDASLYSSRRHSGPQFLLVGDAASFIDPLSSYGVKKALASAWTAAIVVNTCLSSPSMQEHALSLYEERERQVYNSYLRQSLRYFRLASIRHPSAFWTKRAELRCDEEAWEPDEEELRDNPEVRAALTALQSSAEIRLTPSEGVRIATRPGIRDREVVLEPALILPGLPAGIRFLGGVDLPKLVEMAGFYRQVPDLFEAYIRERPGVRLENFLGALSVLLAKGAMRNSIP